MNTFLVTIALLVASLACSARGECVQPFGARAAKVPTSVEKSQVSKPLRTHAFLEVSLTPMAGCCLDGEEGCYMRCVAASYKNVYHNLVDSDKDEIFISTKDLATMTDKCWNACHSKPPSQDAFFTFRSTADVIPSVSSSRLQSPAFVHAQNHPATGLFSSFLQSNRVHSSSSSSATAAGNTYF